MKAFRTSILKTLAITAFGATGCGPAQEETCFCGAETVSRYEAIKAAGGLDDALEGAVVRDGKDGLCVCVSSAQLETVTRKRLALVRQALEAHLARTTELPASLQVLLTGGAVTIATIHDAWFNPLEYVVVSPSTFKLCSGFSDGVLGTEDDVCDDGLHGESGAVHEQ